MGTCVDLNHCFVKVETLTVVYTPIPGFDAGTDDGGSTTAAATLDAGSVGNAGVSVQGGSSLKVEGGPLLVASGTFTKQRPAGTPKLASTDKPETIKASNADWALVLAPRWQFEGGHWRDVKAGSRVDPPVRLRLVESTFSRTEWNRASIDGGNTP
jgi:hypothetical protein